MKVDLHVHSTCSIDGLSSIVEHTRRAAELGLSEIGFCEHADFDPRDRGCRHLDVTHYDREMGAARALGVGVRLRQGVEITYQSRREAEIRAWLAARQWDYVVISVHMVEYADGGTLVSEPGVVASHFAALTQREAYAPYFDELLQAAETGLGQVLGHLDLVKRYGHMAYGPLDPWAFEGEIRAVLRAVVKRGLALELNMSGLGHAPGEPYPSPTILRWYRELGGEILTIGSDAHHADQLGGRLPEGRELAKATGFRAIATFQEGTPQWNDL